MPYSPSPSQSKLGWGRSESLDPSRHSQKGPESPRINLLTQPWSPPNSGIRREATPVADPPLPYIHPHDLPLTTSDVPPDCFEEFACPGLYKCIKPLAKTRSDWGGPISFYPVPYEQNKTTLGNPMRDCLYGIGLKDPDTPIFRQLAEAGKTHIAFVIMWPGYPDLDWKIDLPIFGLEGDMITRREFAYHIACQYQNFATVCTLNPTGPYASKKPRWRVGSGWYGFDRMRLSLLQHIEGDIWQASVRVLTDRGADPNGIRPMRNMEVS
ncbi:hypothetical protein B0H34DRAFT_793144 [Crassisporium funariophilum]|nr:hypothetical protein B0H34DRAFT_793144 [Crassisporium funariophilum]